MACSVSFGGKDLRCNKIQNNTSTQHGDIFFKTETETVEKPHSDYGHDDEEQKWDEIQPNANAGVVIAFAKEQNKVNKGPDGDDGELCRAMLVS